MVLARAEIVEQTLDGFRVNDRVEPAQPTPAMLREFEGHYVSDEVDTRLELLVEDGVLMIRRPPEWNIRLTPVYADAFRGDLGWVTFERDDTGHVTRLNVSQERFVSITRMLRRGVRAAK